MSTKYVAGVAVALCTTFMNALGLSLQKLAHTDTQRRNAERLKAGNVRSKPFRAVTNVKWLAGLALMGAASLLSLAVFALVGQSVASAFAAITIVYNMILSRVFLHERVDRVSIAIAAIMITGTVLVVAFGSQGSQNQSFLTLDEILSIWQRPSAIAGFVVVCCLILAGSLFTWFTEVAYGAGLLSDTSARFRASLFVRTAVAGLFSGFVGSFSKAVVSVFSASIGGDAAGNLDRWEPWVLLILLPTSLVFQVLFLNSALRRFPASEAVPLYQSMVVVCGLLFGWVIFSEASGKSPGAIIGIVIGFLLIVAGILSMLARRRPPVTRGPPTLSPLAPALMVAAKWTCGAHSFSCPPPRRKRQRLDPPPCNGRLRMLQCTIPLHRAGGSHAATVCLMDRDTAAPVHLASLLRHSRPGSPARRNKLASKARMNAAGLSTGAVERTAPAEGAREAVVVAPPPSNAMHRQEPTRPSSPPPPAMPSRCECGVSIMTALDALLPATLVIMTTRAADARLRHSMAVAGECALVQPEMPGADTLDLEPVQQLVIAPLPFMFEMPDLHTLAPTAREHRLVPKAVPKVYHSLRRLLGPASLRAVRRGTQFQSWSPPGGGGGGGAGSMGDMTSSAPSSPPGIVAPDAHSEQSEAATAFGEPRPTLALPVPYGPPANVDGDSKGGPWPPAGDHKRRTTWSTVDVVPPVARCTLVAGAPPTNVNLLRRSAAAVAQSADAILAAQKEESALVRGMHGRWYSAQLSRSIGGVADDEGGGLTGSRTSTAAMTKGRLLHLPPTSLTVHSPPLSALSSSSPSSLCTPAPAFTRQRSLAPGALDVTIPPLLLLPASMVQFIPFDHDILSALVRCPHRYGWHQLPQLARHVEAAPVASMAGDALPPTVTVPMVTGQETRIDGLPLPPRTRRLSRLPTLLPQPTPNGNAVARSDMDGAGHGGDVNTTSHGLRKVVIAAPSSATHAPSTAGTPLSPSRLAFPAPLEGKPGPHGIAVAQPVMGAGTGMVARPATPRTDYDGEAESKGNGGWSTLPAGTLPIRRRSSSTATMGGSA